MALHCVFADRVPNYRRRKLLNRLERYGIVSEGAQPDAGTVAILATSAGRSELFRYGERRSGSNALKEHRLSCRDCYTAFFSVPAFERTGREEMKAEFLVQMVIHGKRTH